MFPTSTPSFTTPTSSETLQAAGHTALHIAEINNIIAFSNKIGTGASTPTAGVPLVGTGAGTSAWGAVPLGGAGVSGILGVPNGGSGTSTSTGSGSNVLNTGPTISGANLTSSPTLGGQPTISDFTNANHGHTNTAGGGTLNAANALQAGSVNYANLLSSIFSGQVQTQANAGTAGGNIYWINLGGIKLMWVACNTLSSGNGANSYTITLPAFFTTIQTIIPHAGVLGTSTQQYCDLLGQSTSTITIGCYSATNGSTQVPYVFVIGT